MHRTSRSFLRPPFPRPIEPITESEPGSIDVDGPTPDVSSYFFTAILGCRLFVQRVLLPSIAPPQIPLLSESWAWTGHVSPFPFRSASCLDAFQNSPRVSCKLSAGAATSAAHAPISIAAAGLLPVPRPPSPGMAPETAPANGLVLVPLRPRLRRRGPFPPVVDVQKLPGPRRRLEPRGRHQATRTTGTGRRPQDESLPGRPALGRVAMPRRHHQVSRHAGKKLATVLATKRLDQ